MKQFLAIYRGEPLKGNDEWNRLTGAEQDQRIQQGMEAWGQWMQEHGQNVVFAGGPLGKTLVASKAGISPTVNDDCGFIVVKAGTHEEAAKMFANHPHFTIFPGEKVEIMECLPVPGEGCNQENS